MSEMSANGPLLLTAGRNSVTAEQVNARREMAVSLRSAGLSMRSTLKEINKLAETKHWGNISLRQLERDIAAYYRDNKIEVSAEELDHIEMLRDSRIAQMENTIEEMSLMIAAKNKANSWRPFEKAVALDKLFKMQTEVAGLNGWHKGGKGGIIINNEVKNEIKQGGSGINDVETWEKLGEFLHDTPDFTNQLVDILNEMQEKISEGQNFELAKAKMLADAYALIYQYTGDEQAKKGIINGLMLDDVQDHMND